jgi:bacteriorhodopsin
MKKIIRLFIGSFLARSSDQRTPHPMLYLDHPAAGRVWISIVNVLASVILMAITLHVLLRRDGFRWQWTLSWLVLIVINMSLYLTSVL